MQWSDCTARVEHAAHQRRTGQRPACAIHLGLRPRSKHEGVGKAEARSSGTEGSGCVHVMGILFFCVEVAFVASATQLQPSCWGTERPWPVHPRGQSARRLAACIVHSALGRRRASRRSKGSGAGSILEQRRSGQMAVEAAKLRGAHRSPCTLTVDSPARPLCAARALPLATGRLALAKSPELGQPTLLEPAAGNEKAHS